MVKGEFGGQILGRAGAGSKIHDFEGMTGLSMQCSPEMRGWDSMQRRGGNAKAGFHGG